VLMPGTLKGRPVLFAGGDFGWVGSLQHVGGVAAFDGHEWSALGTGLFPETTSYRGPYALAVYDDGSGPTLYAAGDTNPSGHGPLDRGVARWDDQTWTPVGSGVSNGSNQGRVLGMAVFNEGSGPALYITGGFSAAGGVPAQGLARWNGKAWSAV